MNRKPNTKTKYENKQFPLCLSEDPHPNSSQIMSRLYKEIRYNKSFYGWRGGVSSEHNINEISQYPITDIILDGDTLMIHYGWQNGVLMLRAVMPRYASTIAAASIQGSWLQDNGAGCVALFYPSYDTSSYIAEGWWSSQEQPERKQTNFIKVEK